MTIASTTMNAHVLPFIIAPEVCAQIDEWLKKYPADCKRSALIPALLLIQEQNDGWLSEPAMHAVAEYLALPPIYVYEAATFYDMYELKPIGRFKINICTNIACMLRDADSLVDCIKQHLGIDFGQTTPDGQFTLRESECMAACGGAPMCQINDREYHENLTPERLIDIITQLQQETK